MPVGAAIGAVGSIGSALIGSNAASNAANAQVQAQQQVLQMLQRNVGPILQQGQSMVNAVNPTLLKLLTPGADMTSTLSQMPGFQFAEDWGQKAVQNLGTTTGLGGNVLTAGAQYATGLAQQGYSNIVNQLQSYLNSGLQTETNAANALSGGQQSALSSIGNANATAAQVTGNALSSGIGGLTNSALLYGLGNKLGIGGGAAGGIYGNGSLFPSSSFLSAGDTSGPGFMSF